MRNGEISKLTDPRLLALVTDLLQLPAEQPWVEFKHNNSNPDQIGVRVSALSNAARLADKDCGYMLWGVRDSDLKVLGTSFQPSRQKVKGEPLQFWLAKRLKPDLALQFKDVSHPDGRLVLLEIPAATLAPVEFDGTAHIRIGSATPQLSRHPNHMRLLWDKLRPYRWELGVAAQFLTDDEVLKRIDYVSFLELTGQPLPDSRTGVIERLTMDRLISADAGGRWNITNKGAILFAKNLDDFELPVARKGVRLVAYDGSDRAVPVRWRRDGKRGYAAGFGGLIEYIGSRLPKNEHIGRAFRTETEIFPEIALRELVANALIHQDMTISGAGPMIELFDDRMEITNPGQPLIQPERFIDAAPQSRNEALADLMRRIGICEEQGTGIDKVVKAVELFQLPPPEFRVEGNAMRVILFAPRRFARMTADERVRACYQHSVLKYLSSDIMRNSSLRLRFGIEPHNSSQVSQVFRAAVERGLIKPADPERPQSGYVPFWA